MTRFAIDAPTLLQLVEGRHKVSETHQLVAPNSLRTRALGILLQQVKSGELSEAAALDLHERMTEMKIRLLGDRVSRRTAWRVAMESGAESIDDAEYVAVAKLQADALVTFSPHIASMAKDVVPLATLRDLTVS